MRSFLAVVGLTLVLPLAACGDDQQVSEEVPSEPVVRDVQHFLDQPEERETVVAECDNNPGELADTPDCTNAYEADRQAMSQGIRDALGRD